MTGPVGVTLRGQDALAPAAEDARHMVVGDHNEVFTQAVVECLDGLEG